MNSSTILIRQVHPSFVQMGRVTSQAFRPTTKDVSKLSTYDGDLIDAESAFQRYTETLGHESAGGMGFLVQECQTLELKVESDPVPFPEHVLIDFPAHGRKQTENISKKLKSFGESRGWL